MGDWPYRFFMYFPLQAMCISLLRTPEAGLVTLQQGGQSQHLFVQLVQLMRQLGVLHSKQPMLKVGPLVLAYKSLSVTASVLQTGFYSTLKVSGKIMRRLGAFSLSAWARGIPTFLADMRLL
jgi:hypothetical protein